MFRLSWAVPVRLLAAVLLLAAGLLAHGKYNANAGALTGSSCNVVNTPQDLVTTTPSNLLTISQAYRCILQHYVHGSTLDDRVLVRAAYSAVRQDLVLQDRLPLDSMAPSLTENRDFDWQSFAQAYRAMTLGIQESSPLNATLAQDAIAAMAQSLQDDHTTYLPPAFMKTYLVQADDSGAVPTLGINTSPYTQAPLYVTDVFTGTPAAAAGLLPGDEIMSVDGQVGYPLSLLFLPQVGTPVTLGIERPSNSSMRTVTLSPKALVLPDTTFRVVAHDVAYVKLYGFTEHAANSVLAALKALHLGSLTKGVILDLRGNPGGYVDQAVRLLSSFTHNAVLGYTVDGLGHREPQATDDSVPILHRPLVVLIDNGSASSSEIVASAVRDLHLGKVVGERSAGALAEAEFFGLSDGSGIEITEDQVLGPHGERVDGIGIAPDDLAVTTAQELATGHDPNIDQAVREVHALAAQQPATAGKPARQNHSAILVVGH